jgi:hypothetical protein
MLRSDFIKWVESISYERRYNEGDVYWRYMVDYADYIFDELEILDDKVIFSWERSFWGGTEYINNEYSFSEFVNRYESGELKFY